jgi:hypothetical protein
MIYDNNLGNEIRGADTHLSSFGFVVLASQSSSCRYVVLCLVYVKKAVSNLPPAYWPLKEFLGNVGSMSEIHGMPSFFISTAIWKR